jgi:hypothetical protein
MSSGYTGDGPDIIVMSISLGFSEWFWSDFFIFLVIVAGETIP